MWTEIIVALIGGGITLIGVLIANSKAQAITDVKIEELTREVRTHNDFARRVPTLEHDVQDMKKHVERLEAFHMER